MQATYEEMLKKGEAAALKYWDSVTPYITDLLPDDAFGICIKLSGGADSSIIYYRLCEEMVERGINLPIYVATLDTETKPWYSHYAKKVIEFTAERTGVRPVEHNIAYLPNPWTIADYGREQDEIAFKSFREGKTNVWYGGLTQNPRLENQAQGAMNVSGIKWETYEQVIEGCHDKDFDRDNNDNRWVRDFDLIDGKYPLHAIHPFVHRDKKYSTAALYEQCGVTDELLPLTYSCEKHYNDEDKVKTDVVMREDLGITHYEEEHCGQCWFCLERAYAFGRLV